MQRDRVPRKAFVIFLVAFWQYFRKLLVIGSHNYHSKMFYNDEKNGMVWCGVATYGYSGHTVCRPYNEPSIGVERAEK